MMLHAIDESAPDGDQGPSWRQRLVFWSGSLVLVAAILVLLIAPWEKNSGKGGAGGRLEDVTGASTGGAAPQRGAERDGDRPAATRRAEEAAAVPAPAQSRPEGLHGRAVDAATGAGIPLFRLVVRPECTPEEISRWSARHPGSGIVVRDPEGRFRARGLEPGPATVLLEATGYRPVTMDVVVPCATALTIEMTHGACLRGRVVDHRGKAVARLPVFIDVVAMDDPADPPPQWRLVETDAAGRFLFPQLSPGRYTLSTPRFGENRTAPLTVGRDQQVEQDLELPFNNALVIRVQDPGGEPLRGAELIITGPAGEQRLQTDVNGLATRFWLEPGSYLIEARFRGRRSEVRTLDLGDYGRSELTLELLEDRG